MTDDYDEISKPVADFFKKGFPSNNSFKILTETKMDRVHLKTATTRKLERLKDEKNDKEIFETTVEPKYEFPEYGAEVELKLQTSNVLSVTLSKSDLLTNGLKLSVNGTQEFPTSEVQQTINLGAEYQHEKFFFRLSGGYPLEERAFPIEGALVVQPVNNIFVGTKFNFDYSTGDKGKLEKDFEFKVAGSSGSTHGHATYSLDKKVGVFVNHSLSLTNAFGIGVNTEFPEDTKDSPIKLSLDFAVSHKINSNSTLNSKLNIEPDLGASEKKNHGIRLGFGLQQNLNCCNTVGIFGADINVSSLIGGTGPSHSLGFELKMKE